MFWCSVRQPDGTYLSYPVKVNPDPEERARIPLVPDYSRGPIRKPVEDVAEFLLNNLKEK